MKNALIAALVGAVVASGSAVAATRYINGHMIQDRSIPATKLTNAAVASLHGLRGPRGYRGAAGRNGTNGTTSITLVRGANVDVAPNSYGGSDAQCPDGTRAVAGGFVTSAGVLYIEDSGPDTDSRIWDTVATNPSSTVTATMHTWATCAS